MHSIREITYKIVQSLTKIEKNIIFGLLGLVIVCALIVIFNPIIQQEPAYGGEYIEGIIGSPRYINPVLAQTNDADLDLVELIYGSLIYDLTDNHQISENQREYTLDLKQNIKWHDNKNFTADDVIFTIQVIQDPVYQSPLRINFQGVGIEKINNYAVKFILKDVYAPFLSSLDIGILPKHIWQEIPVQSFALAEANIKPIGNGPYKFKKLEKDKNGEIKKVELESFEKKANIKKLILKFYSTEDSLVNAFKSRQIDGLSYVSPKNLEKLNNDLNIYKLKINRYFAIFLNLELDKFKDLKTRQFIANAISKKEIINQVLNGHGQEAGEDYSFKLDISDLNLKFNLTTTNWPELVEVAEIIKSQLEQAGIQVEINIVDSQTIQQDYIKPRNYDALLFGEVLGADPDPFAFWHSSQKKDPGFNLSCYDNPKADKLLVDARQTLDSKKREELYKEFEKLLNQDLPAIFLYNPDYFYIVSNNIKNINLNQVSLPSKRFQNIEEWYVK